MNSRALSRKTLLCFSAGSVVETALFGFCGLYLLNFYTDVVHLDPRLVGYAFAIRFIFDALSDPWIGHLSDKTTSKFGRRRPYFLLGAIPAGILFYLLLVPPAGSQFQMFLYLTAVSTGMILALTVFGIPYFALSCELTSDYNERIRIAVYRRFSEVASEMLATLTIPVLLLVAANSSAAAEGTDAGAKLVEAQYYPTAALVIGGVAVLCALITFVGTSEGPRPASCEEYGFVENVRGAFQNKPFLILLVTFTLVAVADRVATSLLFYLLEYFHGIPKKDANTLFLAFFAGSLASPPVWLVLAKRAGKKLAYILSILFYAVAFSSFVVSPWSSALLHLVTALMGVATSGVLILPGAIFPDIVEWDEIRTGQRREGMYAGIAKFSWKLGTGICFFVVGHFLYAVGYDGETPPTAEVLIGLRLIFAGLPGILLIGAAIVFLLFPITPASFQKMVAELKPPEERPLVTQGTEMI